MKRIFFCLLLLMIVSCDKKYESSIPNYPVDIELYLSAEDKDLVGMLSYKTFTSKNLSNYIRAVGFGGVLVYHGLGDGTGQYYAFDLACPHEANRSTRVEVDDDNVYATCPKCNSKFSLLDSPGSSISGPANEERYSLKSYNVIPSGDKLYIRN